MSLHGPRHLYPTAARQMTLSSGEQTEIGHWVENSNQPGSYDSVMSSVEMAAKNKIVWAFQHGRSLCSAGEIPEPLDEKYIGVSFMSQFSSKVPKVVPPRAKSSPVKDPHAGHGVFVTGSKRASLEDVSAVPSAASSSKKKTKTAVVSGPEVPRSLGPGDPPIQVWNSSSRKVHLYHPSIHSSRAICRTWRCGNPDHPRPFVEFQPAEDSINLISEPMVACDFCFRESTLRPLANRGNVLTRSELIRFGPGDSSPSIGDSEESSNSSLSS